MIARNSNFSLSLPDDIRTFVESEALRGGYTDPGDYVCALIREAQARQVPNGSKATSDKSAPAPWELALQIGASVPEAEWDKVPADLATNIDHYLYGASREE